VNNKERVHDTGRYRVRAEKIKLDENVILIIELYFNNVYFDNRIKHITRKDYLWQ